MKKIKFSIIAVLMGVSVLSAAAAFGREEVNRLPGRIELSETDYDFGIISRTIPTSRVFQVVNTGRGPLEITGVSTSCGCTSAGISESRLLPGEAADLKVTFDPLAHRTAPGAITRHVYVRSNDPDTPEAVLTIRMTVGES